MQKRTFAMDELDRKILLRYQHDTRLPAQAIGRSVGLSPAAVQRRLKRMREAGIIEAEVAQLAPRSVGYRVTCIVCVDLERESAADLARFKKRIAAYRNVQQCYYVTGQTDFILVVLARDMEDYEAFTREALLDDPNVRAFTTYVTLDRVKAGVSTPII
jgi:Lrp/AsnC family leucine-responsive transcriptional regulator